MGEACKWALGQGARVDLGPCVCGEQASRKKGGAPYFVASAFQKRPDTRFPRKAPLSFAAGIASAPAAGALWMISVGIGASLSSIDWRARVYLTRHE